VRRTLLISLLVAGAAVALVIGSYSALAGAGPVSSVAGAVIGADEPDDVNVVNADDGDGAVAQQDGEGEPEMVGAEQIADAIAEQFGVDPETVLEQHADDVGFGALFHAYTIAEASGGSMAVEDVLAVAETDGFGTMFQDLREEIAALTADGGPRNLGQLVSAAHHENKGGPAAAAVQGGGQGHAFGHGHGQGKPEGVPPGGSGE
jgi:hypothetical protein